MIGPTVFRLNEDLLDFALQVQPDLIFIYRGTHVFAKTVRKLKRAVNKTFVIGYNNDDPFAPQYPRWKWRHFMASVPEYDLTLAYRKHNIAEYLVAGAKRVELLRSWFIPEQNYPVKLTDAEKDKYGCDVVFIGHYEDDGRLDYLEEIVRRGWHLRIFGPGYEWDPVIRYSLWLSGQMPVQLLWGEDYNKALCGAKIALCFLSQLNRDTYTRRCFEIPASGTVLLSKYTDDLANLFSANQEAMFFKDSEELCSAIKCLITNETQRRQIAKSGRQRVWNDGHDVVSRMQKLLVWVNEQKGEQR